MDLRENLFFGAILSVCAHDGKDRKKGPEREFGRQDIRRMRRAGRFCAGGDPGREGAGGLAGAGKGAAE